MALESIITISIQTSGTAQRPVFLYHVFVDRQTIAMSKSLLPEQIKTMRDIDRQYRSLFENSRGTTRARGRMWTLGKELFNLWLAPIWSKISDAIPYGAHLTLVIASEEPEVLNLPWEMLSMPDDNFIGFNADYNIRRMPRSVARSTETLTPFIGGLPPRPLRVLFVACSPQDRHLIPFEREEAALLDVLIHAGADLVFESCDMGSFDELRERIGAFRPHLVHLSGQALEHPDGDGCFAFEDERGMTDLRSAQEMRQHLFAGSSVQCLFISGSPSKTDPPRTAMGALCRALVRDGGLPIVVGWAASISDELANLFAATFYRALAAKNTVDRSLCLARLAVRDLCEQRSDPLWTLPVLYATTTQRFVFNVRATVPLAVVERKETPQHPLPGMSEGYTRHFVGRRREIQRMLPALRSGEAHAVLLMGLGGVGKSTLATRIARKLEADGYTIITLPSRPGNPINSAMLIERCSDAFLRIGLQSAWYRLQNAELSAAARLRFLVSVLNDHRFLLVLDNFESILDENTGMIARPDYTTAVDEPSSQTSASDPLAPYEIGLKTLTNLLKQSGHPRYRDLLIFEQRLRDNLAHTRLYGETQALSNTRAEVTARLNDLALEAGPHSFNEMCWQQAPSLHEHNGEHQGDPLLAGFYTHLLQNLTGESRVLITSRYPPADLLPLPRTVAQIALGDFSETTFLKFLLQDDSLEERHRKGNLPTRLLQLLYRAIGGAPRFLVQVRTVIRYSTTDELDEMLHEATIPPTGTPTRLQQMRDRYCEDIFLDRLFEYLSPVAQQALCRAAVYNVPVPLEGFAALTGEPVERIAEYAEQWQQYALAYPADVPPAPPVSPFSPVPLRDDLFSATTPAPWGQGASPPPSPAGRRGQGDETSSPPIPTPPPPPIWAVYGLLRGWLLDPQRLDPAERAAAHHAAGDYLRDMEAQGRTGELGLWWYDCLLEARRQYIAAGDYEQARTANERVSEFYDLCGLYTELERINRELLEHDEHPSVLYWIGTSYLNRGDYAEARETYQRMLALVEGSDERETARAWHQLATLDMAQGEYAQARASFERSLAMRQEIGDRAGEAVTFGQFGVLADEQGQTEAGLRLLLLALLLFQRIGHADQHKADGWVNDLAEKLGYSEERMAEIAQEVLAAYEADGGCSLLAW